MSSIDKFFKNNQGDDPAEKAWEENKANEKERAEVKMEILTANVNKFIDKSKVEKVEIESNFVELVLKEALKEAGLSDLETKILKDGKLESNLEISDQDILREKIVAAIKRMDVLKVK